MSSLSMKSLPGSLPVLFIEARLQGPPEIVFSQMGISFDADKCNVALLMRTSGILLFASVGSYMMYRVCARLLGRDFIWTILEQARFDMLARDEYLLNSRMSCVVNNEYDCRCAAESMDDKNSDLNSHTFKPVLSLVCLIMNIDVNQRHSTIMVSESSRYEKLQGSPNVGFSSSEKSVSLHLLWDDPQWDEDMDRCFYDKIVDHDHSISSDVSDMTEFRAAKGLFEESSDRCKLKEGDQTSYENSNRDDVNTDSEVNDFIQKNCVVDSTHLYQITTGFITRTNSMSVSSEHSTRSFPSLRQRFIANASSIGLLELVQSSAATPMVSTEHMMTSTTDSGISRGTVSTSNWQSFFRSTSGKAILGAETFSSEDEALDVMVPCTLVTNKNSAIGRSSLNLISEDRCSSDTSKQSVEWFEDDFCSFFICQDLEESALADMDDPLAACFSGSGSVQKTILFPNSLEKRREHIYKATRDVMAWARDQFLLKSSQLKALQSLYMSDQGWRRIGIKRSSSPLKQFLSSLLHLMFIRGIPFFSCSDMLVAAKAVRRVFSRYEFVQQCSFIDRSTEIGNKEEHAISLLQTLWDLQHGVKYLEDEVFERYCIEAVRLLALLWIVHCFEKTETRQWQQHCPNFYAELFGNSNPRQIIQSLYTTQLNNIQMTLLTDTLRIRLELLDCSHDLDPEQPKPLRSSVPHDTANEYTSRPILTFLKLDRHNFLYPLYHSLK